MEEKSFENVPLQAAGGGAGGASLPAREIFGNLRCDSLLPESIPGCKSVEIAQKFSPPAGSFYDFLVKRSQIRAGFF